MCKVVDVGHHLVGGHEVVFVKRVDDTLFRLAERSVAGYATQHEQSQIVEVDGRGTVNQLAGFIVVIKRLPHEVDVVGHGLTGAVPPEHEILQEVKGAGEGPAVQPFTHDVPSCCGAIGASNKHALHCLVGALVFDGNM
jgi:hypothetical protein